MQRELFLEMGLLLTGVKIITFSKVQPYYSAYVQYTIHDQIVNISHVYFWLMQLLFKDLKDA